MNNESRAKLVAFFANLAANVLCVVLVTATGNARADILFAIEGGTSSTVISTTNTGTGANALIGALGFDGVPGLDADSTNTLFGVNTSDQHLVTIDTTTGVAAAFTAVNSLAVLSVFGITLDGGDNLYGVTTDSGGWLLSNNTTPGPTFGQGVGIGPLGYSSVHSIAFNSSGTLYGADLLTGELGTIDTATGPATSVDSTGFIGPYGCAFVSNDTLYGPKVVDGELLSISFGTGAATPVGSIGIDADALAFVVPEPSSLLMMMLAAAPSSHAVHAGYRQLIAEMPTGIG